MKTVSKTVDGVANVVTFLTVTAVCILAAFLLLPRIFGLSPYIVLSGSMEPVIHTGSVVYIGEKEEVPVKGDIMAYMAGDGMAVVHRIAGVTEDGYIMKGDANEVQDAAAVSREQFIGEHKFSIPELGYLLAKIESHTLRIGSFELPAIVPIMLGVVLLLQMMSYFVGVLAEDSEGADT